MRPQLAELAAPEHTAIVTQECQGAVIGPHAGLALLAEEARRVALPNIAWLLPAARAAGVRVVQAPDYWNALRRHAELVVVDAPAVDRVATGLTLAPFMDLSVLVLAEGGADAQRAGDVRRLVEARGSHQRKDNWCNMASGGSVGDWGQVLPWQDLTPFERWAIIG